MSPLEIAAAALSALSVLFTVRRSLWLWPTGLAGTALYLAVFIQARLYGSSALQVFFLVVQVYGWWWWASRRDDGSEKPIGRISPVATVALAVVSLLVGAFAAVLLNRFTNAHAALPDACIASLSVAAQLLLSWKILENWLFWIAVDLLAVAVYSSQRLYLTAALYLLFLVMATWGLFDWRAALRKQAA